MRKYYLCEADNFLYTESEMRKSLYPQGRFQLIGEYSSREKAAAAIAEREKDYTMNTTQVWTSTHYVMTAGGGYRK